MKRNLEEQHRSFLAGRVSSFRAAFRGLFFACGSQINFRIHLAAMVAVVSAGFYFRVSVSDWCALTLAIGLVLSAELLNTAIELLVDHVSPEFSVFAGRIKDISAAGVLVAAAAALVVGALVFGPRLLQAM